jgi:hypothetical protein
MALREAGPKHALCLYAAAAAFRHALSPGASMAAAVAVAALAVANV